MAIGTPVAIGSSQTGGPSTTFTVNTTANAPAGSLMVVCASWGAGTDRTGTLTGGSLTWATDQSNVAAAAYKHRYGIYSAPLAAQVNSGTTLTLTLSGAGDGADLAVCYVTGLDVTGSRKDTSTGATASTSSWTTGAASNTTPDCLIIGGSVIDFGLSTSTPGGGATELFDFLNVPNDWAHTVTYKIVSSAASQSLIGTWTNSSSEVSAFVAYKMASAGGTVVKPLAQLGVG